MEKDSSGNSSKMKPCGMIGLDIHTYGALRHMHAYRQSYFPFRVRHYNTGSMHWKARNKADFISTIQLCQDNRFSGGRRQHWKMKNDTGINYVGGESSTTGEGYNCTTDQAYNGTGITPMVTNVASQLSPEWLGYCLLGCAIFILLNKLMS